MAYTTVNVRKHDRTHPKKPSKKIQVRKHARRICACDPGDLNRTSVMAGKPPSTSAEKEPYRNVKNAHEIIIWHSPEKISKQELMKYGRMPAREVVVQRERPNMGKNTFTWEVKVNEYTIVDRSKGEFIDTGAIYEARHRTVKVFNEREEAIAYAKRLL